MKRLLKKCLSFALAISIIFSSMYMGLGSVDFGSLFIVKAKASNADALTFMYDYDYEGYYVYDCSEDVVGEVVIPSTYQNEPVVGIGDSAFSYCSGITSIVIPEGVYYIRSAYVMNITPFNECTSLQSITIPSTLEYVGYQAFYGVTVDVYITDLAAWCNITYKEFDMGGSYSYIGADNLYLNGELVTELIIPEGVTHIKENAFAGIDSITRVVLPEGLEKIDKHAFAECSNLEYISIPSSVHTIGYRAFLNCDALEIVDIKDVASWCAINFDRQSDDDYSYNYESLDTPHANPIYYANKVYVNGEQVNKLVIPDGVTHISANAFTGLCIDGIVVPKSLYSVDSYAFYESCIDYVFYKGDSYYWYDIYFDSGNYGLYDYPYIHYNAEDHVPQEEWYIENYPCYSSEDGIAIKYCQYCSFECSSKVLPAGHSIVNNVCEYCNISDFGFYVENDEAIITDYYGDETDIVIPSVLGEYPVTGFEGFYTYGAENVYSLVFPDSVTYISDFAFSGYNNLKSVDLGSGLMSIGEYAFYDCSSLEVVNLPDSLTSIGYQAFGDCSSLEAIEIPDNVEAIGCYAFANCTSLKTIVIPNSVTSIDEYAFYECNSLESITFSDNVTVIPGLVCSGCESLKTVVLGKNTQTIESCAFQNCEALEAIEIPNKVKTIETCAFESCSTIKSIDIPGSVEFISDYVFNDCSSLEEINVAWTNDCYTDIDGVLFNKDKTELLCYPAGKKAESYTIPEGVERIAYGAFDSTVYLKNVVLPDTVKAISGFDNCTSLETITIPEGATSFEYCAFLNCHNLKAIDLPESTTTIDWHAFDGCSSLESVFIPKNVDYISPTSFSLCEGLTQFTVDAENQNYASKDGVLFNKGYTELICYPANKADKHYSVPNTVINICENAICNNVNLESITMGENVECISWGNFYYCEKLATINIPDKSIEIYSLFFDCAYYNEPSNWVNGCLYIGNHLIAVKNEELVNPQELIIKEGTISVSFDIYLGDFESVSIPASLSSYNWIVEWLCGSDYLQEIIVAEGNPSYSSLDGVLFNKDKTELICIPNNYQTEEYRVPSTVTKIHDDNLDGSVKQIFIPLSVNYIGEQGYVDYPYELTILFEGTKAQWNRVEKADVIYYSSINFEMLDMGRLYILDSNEGPYLEYRVNSDGTATIVRLDMNGDYDVPTYYEMPATVDGYTITKIADGVFKNNGLLYSLTIPEGVEEIGSQAFYNCYNLSEIHLPDSIKAIGSNAFTKTAYYKNADNWEYKFEDDTLTYLANGGKYEVGGIASGFISSWVPGQYNYYIEYMYGYDAYCFNKTLYIDNCLISTQFNNYYSLNINEGTKLVASRAIGYCDDYPSYIDELFIPLSIEYFPDDAFVSGYYGEYYDYSGSAEVYITVDASNTNYTSENGSLFNYDKTKLIYIYGKGDIYKVPETVTTINNNIYFVNYDIYYIPEAVTEFGVVNCEYASIAYAGSREQWLENFGDCYDGNIFFDAQGADIEYIIYENKGPYILYCSAGNDYEIEIIKYFNNGNYDKPLYYNLPRYFMVPEGDGCASSRDIVAIRDGAFKYCDLLYSISIPNSVGVIGDDAFYNCYNLSEIQIPNNVYEIGCDAFYNTAYYKDEANWIDGELYINNHLIKVQSYSYDEYTFKPKTKTIASDVFDGSVPDKLIISDGVRSISSNAFGWMAYNTVVIPTSVWYIGERAFACDEIFPYDHMYIFYLGTEDDWNDIYIQPNNKLLSNSNIHFGTDEHTFMWIEKRPATSTQVGIREYECLVCGLVSEHEYLPVLSGFNFVETNLNTYILASYDGVSDDVVIPATHNGLNVNAIGSGCFKNNKYISRVVIPSGVTEIGYLAFMNCSSLQIVSIPATVTAIGTQAFYGFNGTIYCQRDSFAHRYAVENNIPFIIPTIQAANEQTVIDFENQIIYTQITNCSDVTSIISTPDTAISLSIPSIKTSAGDIYGTGSTITVFENDLFMGDFTLVVNSDVNGDSICDALDITQISRVVNGKNSFIGAYALAADTNYDDLIDIYDYQSAVNSALQ